MPRTYRAADGRQGNLNLAASDVHYLCRALVTYYKTGAVDLLDAYSDTALSRVWKEPSASPGG